jgi:hypothetical protein
LAVPAERFEHLVVDDPCFPLQVGILQMGDEDAVPPQESNVLDLGEILGCLTTKSARDQCGVALV